MLGKHNKHVRCGHGGKEQCEQALHSLSVLCPSAPHLDQRQAARELRGSPRSSAAAPPALCSGMRGCGQASSGPGRGDGQEVLPHNRSGDSSAVCFALALIVSQLTPGLHVKPAACTYMCSLGVCTFTGTFCLIICLGLGFLSETINKVIAHIQNCCSCVI